jgi:hypothetical protein
VTERKNIKFIVDDDLKPGTLIAGSSFVRQVKICFIIGVTVEHCVVVRTISSPGSFMPETRVVEIDLDTAVSFFKTYYKEFATIP